MGNLIIRISIIDSRNREVNGFYLNCAQGSLTVLMAWGRIIWTTPAYCCLLPGMARRPCRPWAGYGCSSTPKSGLGVEFCCCCAAKFLAKNGFYCWLWWFCWPPLPAATATSSDDVVFCISSGCCYIVMGTKVVEFTGPPLPRCCMIC